MKLFTLDGRLHLQSPQHACREPAYAEFLALLSRAARFVRNGKPAKPDRDLADALRANPPTGVPVIERILRGPVLIAAAGRIDPVSARPGSTRRGQS
jgi:hypothetical protein